MTVRRRGELIVEGGAVEHTIYKRLRQNDKFPADTKDFYPDKAINEELIRKVMHHARREKKLLIPKPVIHMEIACLLTSLNSRNFCKLTVRFIQDNDPNFHAARIWVKGYATNNSLGLILGSEETLPWEMKAQVQRSPASVLLEKTDEEVIIGVETINEDGIGSGLDSMPTQTITLDGL